MQPPAPLTCSGHGDCSPHSLPLPAGHLPALRTRDEGIISKPQQIITHLRKQVQGAWGTPCPGLQEPLEEEGTLLCHPRVGFGASHGVKAAFALQKYNADYDLSATQSADTLAFVSLLEEKLLPVLVRLGRAAGRGAR